MLGLRLDVLADVPLAHGLGDVPGVGQQRGQGDLAVEAAGLAVHRGTQQTVAHGQAAGHERRPRRGARRLGVARGEQQSPAGQPVDVGRRGPDGHPAAVAPEVAPAHIVEEDHQDVGLPPRRPVGVECGTRPCLLVGQDEAGLQAGAHAHRVRHHRVMGHRDPLLARRGRIVATAVARWRARWQQGVSPRPTPGRTTDPGPALQFPPSGAERRGEGRGTKGGSR